MGEWIKIWHIHMGHDLSLKKKKIPTCVAI